MSHLRVFAKREFSGLAPLAPGQTGPVRFAEGLRTAGEMVAGSAPAAPGPSAADREPDRAA